ncbi:MAG: 30S ribosomal protein S12 methylthiotransferase RimO [Candidatus Cloacimonetes bacterium]|nr:30S ribosomal protein S12 methylthiotransferase RimO [Candidatus Cloacimonadota bacterium]
MKSIKECKTFFIETLGCSKNLVDSENIYAIFDANNLQMVDNPQNADIILVNTCGFIEPAKEESIETIFHFCEYKKQFKCKFLIVTGCLVERYENNLKKLIPEVDFFYNLKKIQKIGELLGEKKIQKNFRKLLTPSHFAYLRISDGCNNNCSYCSIPKIRGKLRSRKISELINEANILAENGVKELIIIAQDIGNYGIDLYGENKLSELLSELEKIDKISWIRLMYLHPKHISRNLIRQIAKSKKICKYLDIPIQHISDKILSKMNRKISQKEILQKLIMIKNLIPKIALRTTIMVGFPGETDAEFQELFDFINEQKFSKLGCFTYCQEDGTKAAKSSSQIPQNKKNKRHNLIMKSQGKISKNNLKKFIGKKMKVIVDKKIENRLYECRTEFDAPDVDGIVYLQDANAKVGTFVEVEIVDSLEYDLIAKI